ncbi:MAG: hypothetical protein U1E38_10540 [Rhodospirillales bacterium]
MTSAACVSSCRWWQSSRSSPSASPRAIDGEDALVIALVAAAKAQDSVGDIYHALLQRSGASILPAPPSDYAGCWRCCWATSALR